ncbi:MAG: hypothetical protein PHY22_03375, partial [Acholeplasmataceae bacterium]|nr:hypothetical protein [Acholeplasmataceae bacterium]
PGFQTLIACFNDYLKALINEENMWLFAQDNLLEIKYDKQLLGYFLQLLLVFYLDLYYYKDNKESQITAFYQYYQAYQINFLEIKTQLKNIQELIKMLNYNVNIDLAFNNYILDL